MASSSEEHLRLLSAFHFVLGALKAFWACIPLIYVAIGGIVFIAGTAEGEGPPQFIGLLFILFGSIFVLIGWAIAACLIIAGCCLAKRKCYTFCFVMACISCISMPFGTILGVFTIIVLLRPEVKEMFAKPAP